jgi:hypothetical protein
MLAILWAINSLFCQWQTECGNGRHVLLVFGIMAFLGLYCMQGTKLEEALGSWLLQKLLLITSGPDTMN